MKFRQSKIFRKSFAKLHPNLKKIAKAKFKIFVTNPHHNSLKTKKMEGEEVWEGHISEGFVFTFRFVEGEDGEPVCEAVDIGTHDIYKKK